MSKVTAVLIAMLACVGGCVLTFALARSDRLPGVASVQTETMGPCEVETWPDSPKPMSQWCDDDRDGTHERATELDRDGRLVSEWHDEDQDGVAELGYGHAIDGEIVDRWFDADEDGRIEKGVSLLADGVVMTSFDDDEDGRTDRVETADRTGRVLTTWTERRFDASGRRVAALLLEHYPDGSVAEWRDEDGDGLDERRIVRSADGQVLLDEVNAWGAGLRPRVNPAENPASP